MSGDNPALLPGGLGDLLFPQAEFESALIERFMGVFARFGYARVKPPLVEFEDSLLAAGPGQALSRNIFRLMDPLSQRMMGMRADVTPQIARIAASRLAKEKRPLRLSYAGDVLRVTATQLRPERQFCQVGCELVGAKTVRDDVEAALIALLALNESGIGNLSVDLTVPTLLPHLYAEMKTAPDVQEKIAAHLDKRDHDVLSSIKDKTADMIAKVMELSGAADDVLPALKKLALTGKAGADITTLEAGAKDLRAALDIYGLKDCRITIDPLETRGFAYQTGLSFTLFARGARGELGRGGRYEAAGESATGFTLYMDSILRAAPAPEKTTTKELPADTGWETMKQIQDQGAAVRRS